MNPVRNNEDIKALPVDELKSQAQDITNAITSLKASTAAFKTPLQLKDHRNVCFQLRTRVEEHLRRIERFMMVLKGVELKIEAAAEAEKLTKTSERTSVSRFLRASSLPVCISKAGADYVVSEKDQNDGAIDASQEPDFSLFKEPVFVKLSTVTDGANFYQSGARTFYENNLNSFCDIFKVKASQMLDNSKPTYHCFYKVAQKFEWSKADASTGFDPSCSDSPSILHLLRPLHFDGRHCCAPLCFQRGALTVFVGRALVIMARPEDTMCSEDFHTMISNGHHTRLSNHTVFLVAAGDTVFIPIAWQPIVIALPSAENGEILNTKKKGKTEFKVEDVLGFTITPALDYAMDLQHGKDMTTFVSKNYLTSIQHMPASYRSDPRVCAWKEQIESRPDDTGNA